MNFLRNFLKGMAVGIATLVPGVSGGTMAIILGIYDDIIHAVGSFFEDWKKHVILLFQIGLGGLMGLALFSRLLEDALTNYPEVMKFLFLGVIIGGLPVLYSKSATSSKSKRDIKDYIFLIVGFVTVLLMSSDPEMTNTMTSSQGLSSILFLFIGGIIIAIALVLPGISGSFMLLALGLYSVTLNAINTMNIPFLIPLGLGVAAGTLGSTKIIERFLQKYPAKTYMLIMGFVLGSLVEVYPGIPTGFKLPASAASFVIGLLFMLWLGRKGITE